MGRSKDNANHTIMHRTVPTKRITPSQTSLMLLLTNPVLGAREASTRGVQGKAAQQKDRQRHRSYFTGEITQEENKTRRNTEPHQQSGNSCPRGEIPFHTQLSGKNSDVENTMHTENGSQGEFPRTAGWECKLLPCLWTRVEHTLIDGDYSQHYLSCNLGNSSSDLGKLG